MNSALKIYEKELPLGRFVTYSSCPGFEFTKTKQTHSNIVLDENNCNGLEADGIVGNGQRPITVLTADCLPIILLGPNGHAFIHAGWKGLHNNILNHEKIKLIKPNFAFIGPHISNKHYEVQADFRQHFPISSALISIDGKFFFSLVSEARTQLNQNFPNIVIEESGICTFENQTFHSYRRNKTQNRNWNFYIQ